MTRAVLISCLLLGAVGCGPQKSVSVNPGRACLVANPSDVLAFGEAGSTVLAADAEATIVVVVSECSSGSTSWENTCDAVVNGLDIEVTAEAISQTPRTQTDDCQFITVSCPVSALSADTYTLFYATESAEITVPYSGEPVCVNAPLLQ